ncbi:MAG: ABC transporter ATP-binding protein [Lentisphaerae bacterium]|nr:ABC transporter ATP-binding protein [Lentisphaerota bacterium]
MPMKTLLDIRDLRTWYPLRSGLFGRVRSHVRAVDGVSLQVRAGETLGIVGESGCGKTTLARTILLLAKPYSGEILLDGRDITTFDADERAAYRRSVQVVFQDPLASLNPRHTILDALTEAVLAHGLIRRREQRETAVGLLADVGLGPEALDRYPHAFSGGQRQRICIARALALKPRLLICDEAVSALDLSVRAQILNLLESLRAKHALSYLFITHDIGVVRHLADRIAVMYKGRIIETGLTERVLGSPQDPYTRALLDAVPVVGGAHSAALSINRVLPAKAATSAT